MGGRGGRPRSPRSRRWRTVLGYGVFGLFSTVAAGLLVVFAVFTVTNVLVWRHLLGHPVTVRVDACGNAGCAGRELAGPELGTYVRNLPHDRPAGSAVRAWVWGGDAVVGVPWGSFVGPWSPVSCWCSSPGQPSLPGCAGTGVVESAHRRAAGVIALPSVSPEGFGLLKVTARTHHFYGTPGRRTPVSASAPRHPGHQGPAPFDRGHRGRAEKRLLAPRIGCKTGIPRAIPITATAMATTLATVFDVDRQESITKKTPISTRNTAQRPTTTSTNQ